MSQNRKGDKPNFFLLNEIIEIFDNDIIIVGSLCDLYYINYAGTIADFDLVINEHLFLEKLELQELSSNIQSKGFSLNIKHQKAQLYNRVSYNGTYKQESAVDIFLTDFSDTTIDDYDEIESKFFIDSSKYSYYKMHTPYIRKKRLSELLEIVNQQDFPDEDWVVAWRHKKGQQIQEKLPLYQDKYPQNK